MERWRERDDRVEAVDGVRSASLATVENPMM
jgi:hypothetical protein